MKKEKIVQIVVSQLKNLKIEVENISIDKVQISHSNKLLFEFGVFTELENFKTKFAIKVTNNEYCKDLLRFYDENIIRFECLNEARIIQRAYYIPLEADTEKILETIKHLCGFVFEVEEDSKNYIELEDEFEEIYLKIRYEKLDEVYNLTEEIINICTKHFDSEFLFSADYIKILDLFKKMKMKSYFYSWSNAKKVAKLINPKFEMLYNKRECKRELKFIGCENIKIDLEVGKIYKSKFFDGKKYYFIIDNQEIGVERNCLEKIE